METIFSLATMLPLTRLYWDSAVEFSGELDERVSKHVDEVVDAAALEDYLLSVGEWAPPAAKIDEVDPALAVKNGDRPLTKEPCAGAEALHAASLQHIVDFHLLTASQ